MITISTQGVSGSLGISGLYDHIGKKQENLEKTIEKLKETQEENEIYDFNSIKNFERDQLISNLILKVWNLTERVKALEK